MMPICNHLTIIGLGEIASYFVSFVGNNCRLSDIAITLIV